MHNQWEELIPFYIANTLPVKQARALESHLATCETCRQSLEQWRAIAGAVKEEATAQGRGLPPLSPQVRHRMATAPQRPDTTIYRRPASFWHPSAVAVAAAAAVLIAVGVLAVLMIRAPRPLRQGSSVSTLFTPTGTLRASLAADASPTATIETHDFGIVTPTTIFINTPLPSATRLVPPTITPTPFGATEIPTVKAGLIPPATDSTCNVFSTSGDSVAAMRLPDVSSEIAGYLPANTRQQVIVQVGGGWYEIFLPDTGTVGWVSDTTVTLSGMCGDVPLPTPTQLPSEQLCYVSSGNGGSVNIYAGPGTSYDILNAFSPSDRPDAMDVSDNGWYRINHWVGGNLWIGWVSPGDVITSGNCNNLGLIPSANYPPERSPLDQPTLPPPTPTAGYDAILRGAGSFPLITRVDIGQIPAGTRVNIGSAFYDGSSWHYGIYTQDGRYADDAPESQLDYAPTDTPG